MARFEQTLLLTVKGGFYLLPFIPLIVAPFFLFPYITGKNFAFRVIVELMAAAWIALMVFNPRRFFPSVSLNKQSMFAIGYALFVGWLFITMLTGVDMGRSFWSNFERMEGLITHFHLLLLILMAVTFLRTPHDWQPVITLSLLASMLLTTYGFLERFGIVVTGTGGERLFATLGNSIYLAEYLMVHLFVIGILLFASSLRSWRIPLLLIGLCELYIFFAASTRGAFLGLVGGVGVAALLYLWLTRRERALMWARRTVAGILIMGALLGGGLFVLRNNATLQQLPLAAPIISLYQAFSSPTQSTQGARLMIWGIAFDALKERPLLGWGPENFIIPYARHYNPSMFGNEPWFDRAHNMFFEWFVAGGVIGGSLYLFLFIALFVLLWHGWRQKIFSAEEVALFCGLIIAYMIQNTFVFDTIVSYLLFFGLGAYLTVRVSSSTYQVSKDIQNDFNSHNASYMLHATQSDPRRLAAAVIIPLFMAIPLVKANINPVMSSARLITALKSVGEGKSAEEVVAAFERTFTKGTFGVTEARERLADILITIATVQGVTQESAPAYLLILNLGIQELEKEVMEHPANVRPLLFLGKLYHLRAAITGSGGAQAIEAYDRLLTQAPNYVQGYLGKAEVHLVRGEYKEAFAAGDEGLRRVGTRAPASVVMTESVALAHVLADDFDGALTILKEPRVRERDGTLRILDHDRIENVAERAMRSEKKLERKAFLEALHELVPTSKKIEEFLQTAKAEM